MRVGDATLGKALGGVGEANVIGETITGVLVGGRADVGGAMSRVAGGGEVGAGVPAAGPAVAPSGATCASITGVDRRSLGTAAGFSSDLPDRLVAIHAPTNPATSMTITKDDRAIARSGWPSRRSR